MMNPNPIKAPRSGLCILLSRVLCGREGPAWKYWAELIPTEASRSRTSVAILSIKRHHRDGDAGFGVRFPKIAFPGALTRPGGPTRLHVHEGQGHEGGSPENQ